MKKTILSLAFVAAMIFTGCSKDDDESNSRSCDLFGLVPVTISDNGDGTATVASDSESETIDLDGTDFNTFADQLCSGDIELDFGL